MSHTKGPWKLSKEWSRHFKISTNEMIVATVALQATGRVVNKANETAEANAKLIASAPELFEAVSSIMVALNKSSCGWNMDSDIEGAYQLLQSSFKKATE